MGAFDDLIPKGNQQQGVFDDLIPGARKPAAPRVEAKAGDYAAAASNALGEGILGLQGGIGQFVQAPAATTLSGVTGAAALADRGITAALNWASPGSAKLNQAIQEEAQRASRFAAEERLKNVGMEGGSWANPLTAIARIGLGLQEDARARTRQIQENNRANNPALVQQQQAISEAEGFVDTAKALAANPLGFTYTLARSAPDMAAGLGVARAVASSTLRAAAPAAEAAAARVAAAGGDAAAQAAARQGVLAQAQRVAIARASGAGTLAEGTSSALNTRESVYQEVKSLPEDRLVHAPRYRELVQQTGGDREAAREMLANELADQAPLLAAAGTVAGSAITRRLFGGDTTAGMVAGAPVTLRKVGKNILEEGFEEGVQNPLEDLAQFGATSQADVAKKFDLGGTVAQGVAAGVAMGGAGSGAKYTYDRARNLLEPQGGQAGQPPAPTPAPAAGTPPGRPGGGAQLLPPNVPPPPADPAVAQKRLQEIEAEDKRLAERLAELSNMANGYGPMFDSERSDVMRRRLTMMLEADGIRRALDETAKAGRIVPSAGGTPGAPGTAGSQDTDLQNRDRTRAASVAQMQSIAANPDYLRLGPSRSPDTGAPMVFAVDDDLSALREMQLGKQDVAVMSDGQRVPFTYAVVDASMLQPSNFADGTPNPGFNQSAPGTLKALNNGRVAGLRAAHDKKLAGMYALDMEVDFAQHGVDPMAIRNTPNPVLVRLYSDKSNTGNMAARSQGQGLGMSAGELARQDAPMLDASVLSMWRGGDVASRDNTDFVRAFVGKLAGAGQDVAGLMTGDGMLSPAGRTRIQAAMSQAAYGDSDLIAEMFDSVDTDIKGIGEALKMAAGSWANMRDSARTGAIDPGADITPALIGAVNLIQRARQEKKGLYDLARQTDITTGQTPDPMVLGALRLFYGGEFMTRALGRDKVAGLLQEYATLVEGLSSDAGLFGDAPTPVDVLTSITKEEPQGGQQQQQQPGAGAQPAGGRQPAGGGNPGVPAGAGGAAGQRPVGGTGGAAPPPGGRGQLAQPGAAGQAAGAGATVASPKALAATQGDGAGQQGGFSTEESVIDPDLGARKISLSSNGEVVGYIAFGNDLNGYDTINMVWVKPEFRGRGLSTLLYKEALASAKRRGRKGLASVEQNLQSPEKTHKTRQHFSVRQSSEKSDVQVASRLSGKSVDKVTFIEAAPAPSSPPPPAQFGEDEAAAARERLKKKLNPASGAPASAPANQPGGTDVRQTPEEAAASQAVTPAGAPGAPRPGAQAGMFDAEMTAELESIRQRDEARAKQKRDWWLSQQESKLRDAAKLWEKSPLASRINAVIKQMVDFGPPADSLRVAVTSGFAMDAKGDRLTEEGVANRENVVRRELAALASAGKPPQPVEFERATLADLGKMEPGIMALPNEITRAMVARYNELGPRLAALGFKHPYEVRGNAPKEAQDASRALRDIVTAGALLANQRVRTDKGYKNANPARLEQAEDFATQVLGMDTRATPGLAPERGADLLPEWARNPPEGLIYEVDFEGDRPMLYARVGGERVGGKALEHAQSGTQFASMELQAQALKRLMEVTGAGKDQTPPKPDTSVEDARKKREERDNVRQSAQRSLEYAIEQIKDRDAPETAGRLRRALIDLRNKDIGPKAASELADRAADLAAKEEDKRKKEAVKGKDAAPAPKAPAAQPRLDMGDPVDALLARVPRFASGLSRVGDLSAGARATGGLETRGVGVDVGELSKNAIETLANAALNQKTQVFVDSGAFSAFRRGLKSGQMTPMDFDAVLERYDDITAAIADINEAEETDYPRPMFVMPDIVGDQQGSIGLARKYRDWIAGEARANTSRVIIPIQDGGEGGMTMAEAYAEIVRILGTDNFIVGVPSNEKAISNEDFTKFLQEAKPKAVHILGAASDRTLKPRLAAIVAAGMADTLEVTADASPIRSAIISAVEAGAQRGQAIEAFVTNQDDPALRRDRERAAQRDQGGPAVSPNTIFTEDAAAAARARLKSRLGRLQAGIDPETMLDGIILAGYHIEKGARKFSAYARAMVNDLGDAVKPYLVSWYLAVRNDPRATGFKADMDRAADVEDIDVDAVLAQPEEPQTPADPVKERTPLPNGMEFHLFTTTDGWGLGQFDTDAGQYVDGSIVRYTQPDGESRARESIRRRVAQILRQSGEAPEPMPTDREKLASLGFERVNVPGWQWGRSTRDADGTIRTITVRRPGGTEALGPVRWTITASMSRKGMAAPPDIELANEPFLDAALEKAGVTATQAGVGAGAVPSLDGPEGRMAVARSVADSLIGGEGFDTIVQARRFISELTGQRIEPGTEAAKLADETIEMGVVLAGREMVRAGRRQGRDDKTIYDRLVGLYERQPTLGVRTSTSVREQAYSTPVPLAFLASRLARVAPDKRVGEPTAGNTMLLLEVDPANAVVNELNANRAANATALGFTVSRNDAARTALAPAKSLDVAVMNPPFGAVKGEDGQTIVFPVAPNYGTREVDHAIVFKSLEAMKDDGTAVLIVGGVEARDPEQIREGYRGSSKREFYFRLYNQYNVVDHFTVDGSLYSKQGAGYPVDVIVINGRGKAQRALPAAELPVRYDSWANLKGKLDEADRVVPAGVRPASDGRDGAAGFGGDAGGVAGRPGRPGDGTGDARPGAGAGSQVGVPGAAGAGGRQPQPSGAVPGGGQLGTAPEPVPPAGGAQRPVPGQGPGAVGAGAAGDLGNRSGAVAQPRGAGDEGAQPGRLTNDRRGQEEETAGQATYEPRSGAASVGTLVPRAMRDYVQQALTRVEEAVGNLDAYVADKLGYPRAQLASYFSAEQVDALAMAIYNDEKGAGFIIGDQTGVGKGRIVAAMIRYALRNGKVPIFVTEKPNLYADMIRDLDDIGMAGDLDLQGKKPRILMTNVGDPIPYVLLRKGPDGEPVELDMTLRPAGPGKVVDTLLKGIAETGDLGPYKVVFTTYSQMQQVNGKVTERMRFLQAMAPRSYIIFDESHNAGGTQVTQPRTKEQREAAKQGETVQGRAGFTRGLVRNAAGTFFSSATYAKRPDVMDLYSSTNMMLAVSRPADLSAAIALGGVPMQQIVATMLAEDGQYLRRERTFAGVGYETRQMTVDKGTAENMATAMRMVLAFSRAKEAAVRSMQREFDKEGALVREAGGEKTSVQGANFGAIMHNLIDQMLLSLKARDSVQFAIERLKAGEKVVLTVSNTMGSFLGDYAEEMGLRPGEPVSLSFSDLYRRYLDKQRMVKIKRPGGKIEQHRLTDEELGEGLVAMYQATADFIESAGFGSAPISPIDYMHAELRKAGFKTDEITGRSNTVDYQGQVPVLASRSASIRQRLKAIRGFNSGEIDALILNQSGSTGLSLHASAKFKDQRKRRMIIVQAEKNIDTHMQMLGRVHRTGQVITPDYTQSMADIPAEMRPAAVLMKKMASLNANTTGDRKSAVSAEGVVDFMNDYGGQVAAEFLLDNRDIHLMLGGQQVIAVPDTVEEANDELIRKLTGYIPILPIEMQEQVYADLIQRFNDLIARENAMGTNKLEAKALDLKAKTLSSEQVTAKRKKDDAPEGEGEGNKKPARESVFADPAFMERVDVARTVKPLTKAEVEELVRTNLGGKSPEALRREMKLALDQKTGAYIDARSAKLAADGADAMRIAQEVETIGLQKQVVQAFLNEFLIGDPVKILDSQQIATYGIVTNIVATGNTKNPAAASNYKVTFALANGEARSLTVGASQIGRSLTVKKETSAVLISHPVTADTMYSTIADMFDLYSGGSVRREKRWMVTGNLLSGFADYPGQIITFTTEEGTTRQGVLMRRNFDYDKEKLKGSKLQFNSPQQVLDFLMQAGKGAVVSAAADHSLRITVGYGFGQDMQFEVLAAGSKREGGTWFLDKGLTSALGTDFFKRGPVMRAFADVPAMRRALQYLLDERGEAKLTPSTHPDIARKVLGLPDLKSEQEKRTLREEQAVYRVKEPENNYDVPYDLFPETQQGLQPLPSDPRINSLAVRRAAPNRDLDPTPVLAIRQDPALPGLYHYSSQIVQVGKRDLPVKKVTNWLEASSALAAMGQFAVEHLDVLITDKDGKPLAVVGSFKGTTSSTAAYPETVVAEALRIEGATQAWGVHNHPSGTEELSTADKHLSHVFERMFGPSTVKWMGIAAIGDGRWKALSHAGPRAVEEAGILLAGKTVATVPVVERTITRANHGMPVVSSPQAGKRVIEQSTLGNKPGIMFLDAQGRVTAFVPVKAAHMAELRKDGRFDKLINAAAQAGASSAIINNPNDKLGVQTVSNIGAALTSVGVRILDVVDKAQANTWAEMNKVPPAFGVSVMSRASAAVSSGMNVGELRALAARVKSKMPNMVEMKVLASPADAPDGVRALLEENNAMADVEAVLYQGSVLYVFASGMSDAMRAEHVIAKHEAAHVGLRALLGGKLPAVMNMIAAQNGKVRAIAQQLRDRNPKLSGTVAIEEAIVDMADGELVRLKGWRRLVEAVRDWMRDHGYRRIAAKLDGWLQGSLTEQERADLFVADLVRSARDYVAGKAQGAGKPQETTDSVLSVDGPRRAERFAELAQAAGRVATGEMTGRQYATLANSPEFLGAIAPFREVPAPATDEQALAALASNKKPAYNSLSDLQRGDPVGLRLDIPAYTNHGVWVNSIHPKGKSTRYAAASAVTEARFPDAGQKALDVARGLAKAPFARIEGKWLPMTAQQAVARAQEAFSDPAWTQVGYNPLRHSFFFDRRTGEPVTQADEVIQIGPLVLAKNAKIGDATDPQFLFSRRGPAVKTDTPEFRRWFGDSKVVDENGEPLVVYHSTLGDFSVFEKTADIGFHFGSTFVANSRAEEIARGRGRGDDKISGMNVMPVYLSIQNPVFLSKDPGFWMPKQILSRLYDEVRLPRALFDLSKEVTDKAAAEEAQVKSGRGLSRLPSREREEILSRNYQPFYDALRDALEAKGYDGIQYVNEYEGEGKTKLERRRNLANMTYIAFRPEQIKSAIGNSGAFDPDNADIRMSRAPQSFARQTWLTWDWARNRPGTEMTKVANRLGQPKIVYHSTNSDFYEFKVGDIGFHFGTPEQARAIGGKRTIKAYLSIHNPLEMADQGDHWDLPHRWAWDLMRDGIFTQAEVDRLEDVFLNAKPGEQTATELAREMLLAKGYDGIVYDNETEGPGQSWIALLPQQIKEVGNVEFSPSNADFRMSRAPAPQTVAARAEAIITKASNPPKPLDRLARVATKVTGIEFAMGKLYDTSGYLLDRLVPETVKAGVVSDYGVEEAVIDQRVLLQGRQRVQLRKAGSLLEKLATLTREESRIAYEWMNMDGSDPRAYVSMMQGLPEESVRVLQEVQQMIDSLSREAVRLGQLDPRSYEKLKFAYLRRSYAKYLDELKTPEGRAPARQRATRILGDQYRNRGILEPVEMAKIKAVDPEWWGVKLREGRGDAGLVNQKFIRLERRANAGEGTAPLPGMTGRPQGKVLETVYWPAERAVPARYAEWTREEVYEVRDVKGSKLILYRDFTKDEREQMGEIDEARFAIARTLQRMIHDVEVGRYLEWMAQNMAKADGDAVDGTIVESGEGGWFSYLRVYKPGEWVKVPETKVEGTSVAKYGKLAGLYLPGPVWNDVRQMVNGQVKPLGETYDAVLRAWKTSKTALSPAVHTNNIMANIVMADWHDVSTAHVAKALRILLAAHDRKGEGAIGRVGNVAARAGIPDREAAEEILNRYRDSGGDIGSWATQEIARDQFEPLLEAVEAELRQNGPLAQGGQVGIMAALQHLLHLKMPEAWAAFKGSKPATLVGREGRSMIDLYQAEDDVFRLAAWLREKEQGRSDLDAGRAARKTFLDYDINAPWVEAMRRTGWPFIAFTYRAAPMLAHIAGKKPHKILKLMAAAGALNALGVMLAGGGDDDERKLLPEEKAGRVWGMVPKLIRMPWNDANGSPVYLDIRRWVPVGDIVDTGQTQSAVPIPPSLMPGGPLTILGEVLLNKSSFTGKELVKETDTAAQSAGKVIDHLYKAFAPNLLGVPGTYATEGVVKAGSGETDAFGRERSTAQAVASAFGVKLGSYPRDVLEANQRARFNARKREVEQNIRALARQLDRKGITQQEYDQLVEREQEKLRKEGERFQKMMETAD